MSSNNIAPSDIYFADKVILVTGCNGFLGKEVLSTLLTIYRNLEGEGKSSTHHIYAIDNGITSNYDWKELPKYVTMISANAITYNFNKLKNVDIVVHMAGLASPAQYKKYPLETIDVACSLTRTLLEKCVEWKSKFVFFSSSEIYGNPSPDNIPTMEDYKGYVSCQGPRACYDESKRMGETLCYVFNKYYGIHTNIIRPFNIYGPGMGKYDYRMIPNLMRAAVTNAELNIYGSGVQTRTFCYLDDAIEGIILVLKNGGSGETYNIGNDKPEVSMIDLINNFREMSGLDIKYKITPYPDHYPADEPLRRCPNLDKAINELGYQPRTEFLTGLKKTYDWARTVYTS